MTRQLHLNTFVNAVGHHEAAWRLPGAVPNWNLDIEHYKNLARIAERGLLDSVFFADIQGLISSPSRRPGEMLDPVVKLTALAGATERIGLIGTASTTFDDPFNLARRFASADLVSGGRVGWNVVTSIAKEIGPNFGVSEFPTPEERYERADEFLDVVLKLWDSWEADALVVDKARGVYADPAKVHRIDHVGRYFSVQGPSLLPPTPQGRPVIVQAGSSGPGIAFAAKYAEAVFTAQGTIEEGRAFYANLKSQAAGNGRNPDHVIVLPGIVTVIGGTEAEAQAKARELDELIVLDHAHAQLAEQTGLPIERLPLDRELPDDIRRPEDIVDGRSRYEITVEMARRERLTVRELLIRLNGSRGHQKLVGTPEQIADVIETWFTTGASDGFNVMPATFPDGLEDFVDHVVPILRGRGLFRSAYEATTLRGHYGLPAPEPTRGPAATVAAAR
ncbi:LLM class flavin-dependent oxidoreductase [Agromyces aerolatus]|uniref:LLM class flavin-dependent oxidoreductase n=1 Tax=Agromyces sp. LY-1074 TaxID=3074080 RepID=UPI00285F0806|nr:MULTISPECIES: LLM class flavin-dependent oxidoreductase [unclassified Agromyces]MDR5699108.1 LLM class flavin-dependent oxidoreductase [Agromyces sp. LY-1074]MDR5705113.1 LLM class flavin-dependent oxidoreductase [Agromyces sp. LY-1358]